MSFRHFEFTRNLRRLETCGFDEIQHDSSNATDYTRSCSLNTTHYRCQEYRQADI